MNLLKQEKQIHWIHAKCPLHIDRGNWFNFQKETHHEVPEFTIFSQEKDANIKFNDELLAYIDAIK